MNVALLFGVLGGFSLWGSLTKVTPEEAENPNPQTKTKREGATTLMVCAIGCFVIAAINLVGVVIR